LKPDGSGSIMEERLEAQATVNARAPLRPLHRGGGNPRGRILLVEDEPDQAAILEAVLRAEGLDVVVAASGEQALEVHHRTPADVLVTDLNLPGMTGVELMRRLSPPVNPESTEPVTPPPAVVVVTGQSTVSSAIEALKLGAADYLQKPLDPARLVSLVRELLASDNVREADNEAEDEHGALVFEGMVGGSKKMREIFARIERVAATMAPVLIVGESGTGKELVARAIHNRSRRHSGPFVPVHTGAIPKELIGSELFGHEKGSFTGAFNAAEGKFEAAATGTVFLDEVGTMDTPVQVSLLRVLETYRFTRVGGRKEIEADVRIVAATNRDLLDLVDEGTFREDLYYRLNVFTVALPPLRERREDILPIAERFLGKYAKRYQTPARKFSRDALERIVAYDWPGNVRELRNVVEQTALFAPGETVQAADIQLDQGRIERRGSHRRNLEPTPAPTAARASQPDPVEEAAPETAAPASDVREAPRSELESARLSTPQPASVVPLPERISPVPPPPAAVEAQPAQPTDEEDHPLVLRLPVGTRLADAERKLILLTLEAVRGNKQRAARVLGISRRGLYSKLQAYGEHVTAADAAEHAENEANAADEGDEPGADAQTN
jgi:DNA-binding NtrC family response regulator